MVCSYRFRSFLNWHRLFSIRQFIFEGLFKHLSPNKVGCVSPMFISLEFGMEPYRDDHRVGVPHFTFKDRSNDRIEMTIYGS